MFSTKYLIGIAAATTLAGGVAATTLLNKKTNEGKEKEFGVENSQKETKNTKTPAPIEESKKSSFWGKLVFVRENKNFSGLSRVGNIFYEAQLLTKEQYKEKLIEWNTQDEDDDYDPTFRFDIEVFSEKNISQLNEYLKELNEKLKTFDNLEKLKQSLESNQGKFIENFGKENYDQLIKKISELKPNPSN